MHPIRLAAPVTAIALCLSAMAGPAVAAEPSPTALPPLVDVPEYRNDNHRTSDFAGPGPVAEPVQVWSRSVEGGMNFTPQLVDGRLLFGAGDGNLYALDARTGEEIWRFAAGTAIDRFGSYADGIYAFSSTDGNLHALDIDTGKESWSWSGAGVGSVIEDGVVYVPGRDNHAYGLDLATGKEVWSWAAPANVFYLSVADGTAYASVDDGRFYAVSVADGTERWHLQTVTSSQGIPMIGDDRVFVTTAGEPGDENNELDAVDRASGETDWTFQLSGGHLLIPGALAGGVYYAETAGDGLYAFPADEGGDGVAPGPLWHAAIPGAANRNVAVSGDTAYVPVWDPDELVALDASDGTERWTIPLADHPNGTLVSGGMLFVADWSGVISAYAEPALAEAIGATVSGPLSKVASVEQPPNPFTVIGTLDPSTTTIHSLLAFDVGPDGLIYALDMKPSVTVIDPATGTVVRTWGRQGTREGEFDLVGEGKIAVSPDGTVFVSDSGNHRIQVFSPDGTFIRHMGSFGTDEGQFSRPFYIASDDQGSVYVLDDPSGSLTKFDQNGAFVWRVPGVSEWSQSAVQLNDGSIAWLRDSGRVQRLDPATGAPLDSWGSPGHGTGEIGDSCLISVDGLGNEYIFGCEPDRTQAFNPDHQLIAGAYAPRDQVVVPVFGPNGAVYGHSAEYSTDDIYILKDSLLP